MAALLTMAICFLMVPDVRQAADSHVGKPMAYELYSWRGENGSWNFSISPSPSGVANRAETVFDKKFALRGTKELKRKIASLPAGATIIWCARILEADQDNKTEKLAFPSERIITELQRYAESRKIKINMLSA